MTRFAPTRRQFSALGLGGLALAACGRVREHGGVLRIGLAGGPDSLDPHAAEFAAAAILFNQIHAPLEGARPGHGLVEQWTPNEDASEWRVRLRDSLSWSDGAPLTAADVVWSVRRAVGPGTSYSGAPDLLPIAGAEAALRGAAPAGHIGVTAPDPRTIVFTLTGPLGVFPETMRTFYPVPPHAIERHGNGWTRAENFVGAGPYLPRAIAQQTIMLARNPDYFGAAGVSVAEIEMAAIDDAGTRLRMFRSGDLDLAQDPAWSALAALRGADAEAVRSWPAPRFTYLKINHARPALSDVRVRRALAIAADRDFIANTLFHGAASPAETIIPGSPNAHAGTMEARRDEARALLRAAGAQSLTVELIHSGGEREGLAVALADDWAAVGVRTDLLRSEATGLYAAVDEGRFDLALSRFDRGLRDAPWRYLEPFTPGGFAANFNWDSPALAEALAEIRAEPDGQARSRLAYAAERAMLAEAPIVPIQHERAAWLIAPSLRDSGDGQPLFWADLAFA